MTARNVFNTKVTGPDGNPQPVGENVVDWALGRDANNPPVMTPNRQGWSVNDADVLTYFICSELGTQYTLDAAGYDAATRDPVFIHQLADAQPVTKQPTQLNGRIPVGTASLEDFYYVYKLAGQPQANGNTRGTDVVGLAFSGRSDEVSSVFNAAINNHPAEAASYDVASYQGQLLGI